ncbi:MAG TPA: hypothetical protein VGC28_03075 [Sphingomonas sp.]
MISTRATRGVARRLSLALALLPLQDCHGADPANAIRLEDQRFYTKGSYSAYAAPWSIFFDKSLRRGDDYLDSIVVDPAAFPRNTGIEWRWPFHHPKQKGVWGYLEVSYGNYDGGIPAEPVQPRQALDIAALSEHVAWSGGGIATSFNLLNEFYLTREAGKPDDKVIEVGLLLHPHDRQDWEIVTGRPIGRYVEPGGRAWRVVMNGTYCMFVPDEDVHEATIDLKAMIDFLITSGVITGSEWFNGVAVGVEPVWGRGAVNLSEWSVDLR